MRFGLSDLDELPSLKEFEALAREALGSDEGVAPSETSDESVLDAPRDKAMSPNEDASEQTAATAPQEVASDSRSNLEEETATGDDQAHKTAAAGE
jgi:hypothetical protein